MIRWILYLVVLFVMSIVAFIVTPLLPLFREWREGPIDNNHSIAYGWRLPKWLFWFDTPDNPLTGDSHFRELNEMSYWSMVKWLYRNSLYGFKWSVLAAERPEGYVQVGTGDKRINRNNGIFGTYTARIVDTDYWQWKRVKPIGNTGYCTMLNFGWLLDDLDQKKCLFMFSPRICKIKIPQDQK